MSKLGVGRSRVVPGDVMVMCCRRKIMSHLSIDNRSHKFLRVVASIPLKTLVTVIAIINEPGCTSLGHAFVVAPQGVGWFDLIEIDLVYDSFDRDWHPAFFMLDLMMDK